MDDLTSGSATEQARAVRERTCSPVELVEAHIARIEALDGTIGAFVARDFEAALEAASVAERRLDEGADLGPLHGVPVSVKECIEVAGLPATAASRVFAGRLAETDAPAVANLRRAGAIVLGKTNLSEFAGHYDSVNDLYGETRNPHDPARSAGGSSGGEAAAVAARMSALGVGSDLGSSIRAPADWCGITGMRPSRGLVPAGGHFPYAESWGFARFAEIGPLARSVDDLALGLEAISGRPLASAGLPETAALFEQNGLQPVSSACREAARRAAAALSAAGVEVVEELPPDQAELRAAYDTVLASELRQQLLPLVEGREHDLTPLLRGMLDDLRGLELPPEAYERAQATIVELERRADAFLQRRQLLVCPVAPTTAVPLGGHFPDEIDGVPMRPGGKMSISTYANALGLPALNVPVMRAAAGLPVGAQLVARRGHDAELLEAARIVEGATGGYIDPDGAPRSAI